MVRISGTQLSCQNDVEAHGQVVDEAIRANVGTGDCAIRGMGH